MPEIEDPADPRLSPREMMLQAAGQLVIERDAPNHGREVHLTADQGMALRVVVANGFAMLADAIGDLTNAIYERTTPR